MDNGKFWVYVNAVWAIALCVIVITSVYYWDSHNAKVADMVKGGANPVEVMCALQDDYGTHPVCIVIASKD